MNNDLKKKLIVPFFTGILFFVINISSLVKGIEQHQTWRVILAGTSQAFIIAMLIYLLYKIKKAPKRDASQS